MTKLKRLLIGVAIMLLTVLVYRAGLFGGFMFDDQINILENDKLHITSLSWNALASAATSINAGPLARPLSMMSFALNILASGPSPFFFKATNLFIHILVGGSLYWLTRRLLDLPGIAPEQRCSGRDGWVAYTVVAAWLLHPFNLTGVLYVVQRMASLSALFCVLGMMLYVIGRQRLNEDRPGFYLLIVALLGCGALAILSKESGALLPIFLFLIEWLFFGFSAPKRRTTHLIIGFHVGAVLIPALAVMAFLLICPEWMMGGYAIRDFTMTERLLTESRVVCFYLSQIVFPSLGQMGLYHDDIAISKGFFSPVTTAISTLTITGLILLAILNRKTSPIFSFGILFFFSGHLLESSIFGLEIAHEHRNYLPDYGIILAVFFYLIKSSTQIPALNRVGPAFAGLLVLVFGVSTAVRASYWGNDLERSLLDVRHHPQSARSHIELAYTYALFADYANDPAKYLDAARSEYLEAMRFDRSTLTPHFALLALDSKSNASPNHALLTDILESLANRPLASASVNALINLSVCKSQGNCLLDPEVLWQFFEAVLKNRTLAGFARSQILTEMTQHKVSAGELDQAVTYAENAVNNFPSDPQFHLNYANVLISIAQSKKANDEIALARLYDVNGYYRQRIARQEQLLAETSAR